MFLKTTKMITREVLRETKTGNLEYGKEGKREEKAGAFIRLKKIRYFPEGTCQPANAHGARPRGGHEASISDDGRHIPLDYYALN